MGFPDELKFEVKKKAHFRCVICNSFGPLHVHHIIPTKDGGTDDFDNAVSLCPNCHSFFGDSPSLRKWIREKRDFWYEKCEKILNYDNLEQLEKTYDLLEDYELKKDEKIQNLEQKIDILNQTIQQYATITNNFITQFPNSGNEEKQQLVEQIGTSSNVLAVSGAIMENFSRREKGSYYDTKTTFYKPSDSLDKFFVFKKKTEKKK